MARNIVGEGFRILLENGLVEILIFALIFAVVFGILMNVHLFGEDNKNEKKLNAVIALVLAALSILPHYIMRGSRFDLITIVKQALPQTMLVLIVLLAVLILLGMFGWKVSDFSDNAWLKPIIAIGLFGLVIWLFFRAAGGRLPNWLGYEFLAIIIALAVFGGIVYFVIGKGDE